MKHKTQPFKHNGLCFICGKPTRLLIHGECGRKAEATKKAIKIKTNVGDFNQQNKENAINNKNKKKYLAGVVPPFCGA